MQHVHFTLNDADHAKFKSLLPEHGSMSRVLRHFIQRYVDYDGDFDAATKAVVVTDRRKGLV